LVTAEDPDADLGLYFTLDIEKGDNETDTTDIFIGFGNGAEGFFYDGPKIEWNFC